MVKDALACDQGQEDGPASTTTVRNVNRSIGARVSGEIARHHGACRATGRHHPSDAERLRRPELRRVECRRPDHGAGRRCQRLRRQGHGRRPARDLPARRSQLSKPTSNIIIGNTCLYGATGGELYAAGMAGERFAVRNSGALAVVEGRRRPLLRIHDRRLVVVLGDTGVNFGAGMTGGFAYVSTRPAISSTGYNHELIDIAAPHHRRRWSAYRMFLQGRRSRRHLSLTGSVRAAALLADFRRLRWASSGWSSPSAAASRPWSMTFQAASGKPCQPELHSLSTDKIAMGDVFQFLNMPRRDGEKTPAVIRIARVQGDLRPDGSRATPPSRPGAAWPAAIRTASGSARCTTTSRTG